MLATTNARKLLDAEKIQHTIDVYKKIKQTEIWAQWVRNQVDLFEEGSITVCQTFMNKALVKYNRIIGDGEYGDVFHGSTNTLQQDIVVMLANANATKVNKRVLQKKLSCNDADDGASDTTGTPSN